MSHHRIDATTIKNTVSTYIAEFRSTSVDDIELRIEKVSRQNSHIIVTGYYSIGFLDDRHHFEMTFDESLNPIDIKVPSE